MRSLVCRHIDGTPTTDCFDSAQHAAGPTIPAEGHDKKMRKAIRSAHDVGLEVWLLGEAWTADSHPRSLFLCSCGSCAQAAVEMGYDMPQMIANIYDALERLKRVDAGRLVEIAKSAMGPFDFMQLLGIKPGVVQWFKFRSELIAAKFARFRDAVHATTGNLIAHADIFQLGTIVVWAQFLQHILPALSEADALQIVYRFIGYDSLDMPTAIDDFMLGDITKGFSQNHNCEFRNVPLKDLLLLDMAKARLYLPKDIPSYPIIQGGGFPHNWPRELIQEVISGAEQLGHQGIILQGTRSLVDFELKDAAFW